MKTECVEIEGIVEQKLPCAFYRVKIDKLNIVILAYLSGKMGKKFTKPEIGDKVMVEMSPTDSTKGRIMKRF